MFIKECVAGTPMRDEEQSEVKCVAPTDNPEQLAPPPRVSEPKKKNRRAEDHLIFMIGCEMKVRPPFAKGDSPTGPSPPPVHTLIWVHAELQQELF